MEGADEILARRRIDRRLAANRRIDLREQRRRHLDELAAAPQDAGGKAGQVADDTAAERHHRVAALHPQLQQPLGEVFERRPVLGGFAGRQDDLVNRQTRRRQPGGERRQVQCRDMGIRHHRESPARCQPAEQRRGIAEQAGSDMDGIGAVAQRHVDNHGGQSVLMAASAAMMASTVSVWGPRLLPIWIGASA